METPTTTMERKTRSDLTGTGWGAANPHRKRPGQSRPAVIKKDNAMRFPSLMLSPAWYEKSRLHKARLAP